jgi:hypothetical protein
VLFPQATGAAERVNPAFGAHARAGEDHDVADIVHLPHEAGEPHKGKA